MSFCCCRGRPEPRTRPRNTSGRHSIGRAGEMLSRGNCEQQPALAAYGAISDAVRKHTTSSIGLWPLYRGVRHSRPQDHQGAPRFALHATQPGLIRFMDPAPGPSASIVFGRFQVLPHSGSCWPTANRSELGGRAFDVLMALIEAHGAVRPWGAGDASRHRQIERGRRRVRPLGPSDPRF